MKILIVDDDPGIVENLELTFKVSWPESEIISTGSGKKCLELIETEQPDLVILDIGLNDISGFDVIKQARLFSSVPIVVLTVKSEEAAVVKAIGSGADEFIVKPFRQMELLTRINAIFRRKLHTVVTTASLGSMVVDFASNTIITGSRTTKLTSIESIILHTLLVNSGNMVSISDLGKAVWGEHGRLYEPGLRVHIRNLRLKIEADPSKPRYIVTSPGMGYYIPEST